MTELIDLEALKGLNQEELSAKLAEANENYKDLKSNSDRWVQKVLEEKKLAERSLKAISEIDWKNDKFVELYEEDPKLWNYLLENVFEGASIDDFREWGEWAKTQPKINTKDDFEKYYQQKQVEEKIEKISSKLTAEAKEKFTEEFNDISNGKELNTKNVDKYIKIALRESQPDLRNEENMAKLYAIGWSKSKSVDNSKKWDSATSDFLQQMGVTRKVQD